MKTFIKLILAASALNNCTVQTHQYFYNLGREGSYAEYNTAKLLKAGDTLYAETTLHSYDVERQNIIGHLAFGNSNKSMARNGNSPRTVYGKLINKEPTGNIPHWERADTVWLTRKPEGAIEFTPAEHTIHLGEKMLLYKNACGTKTAWVIDAEPAHPTAHALYAYPLAAISLIAVDIPAMIGLNTILTTGYIMATPFRLLKNNEE